MSFDSVGVLRSLATSLIAGEAVEPRTSYEESSVAALGLLVMQLSSQLEVAAEWLVEENATLRALFRKAAPIVAEAGLAERLGAAGHGFEESLRISLLRTTNAELRGLLIELHAHVEKVESAASGELDEAIWAELDRSVYRRAMS